MRNEQGIFDHKIKGRVMNFKKLIASCLFICLLFSLISGIHVNAWKKTEFLEITSITGKSNDPNSFSLQQNLFSFFYNQYQGKINDVPYFHQGLTLDSAGFMYFCDKGDSEIEVYDAMGKPIRTIGSIGTLPGQFQLLSDICIDQSGRIYALDTYKKSIQIFRRDGSFEKEFTLSLPGDENTACPVMMTLSNDKRLFVIDINNGGKVFSKEGTWLMNLIIPENFSDIFTYATDICEGDSGDVYVLNNYPEDGSPFIMIFGADGKLVDDGIFSLAYGENERERNISTSLCYFDGKLYLPVFTEIEDHLMKTSFKTSCLEVTIKKINTKEGTVYLPVSTIYIKDFLTFPTALIKTNRQLIALDAFDNRIVYFDSTGYQTKEIKSSLPAQIFEKPSSILYDIDENLYICDPAKNRVTVMNFESNEMSIIGSSNALPAYSVYYDKGEWEPTILEKDNAGNLYIYDDVYKVIHVLDSQGNPHKSFSTNRTKVLAMDFDQKRNLFVLARQRTADYDGFNVLIDVYSIEGNKTPKIDHSISIPDYLVCDITIGNDGNIYVADLYEVIVYSKTGDRLNQWNFENKWLTSIYYSSETCIYVLAGSELFKVDSKGEILNQQDLGWLEFSDITSNNQGELYLSDHFHGLVLTIQDKTTVKSKASTPILLSYVPTKTYFDYVVIQGRTSPRAKIKIQNVDTTAKKDGTFSERVKLSLVGGNEIVITAKTDTSSETTTRFLIQRMKEETNVIKVGYSNGKDGKAFIDPNTKRTYVPFRFAAESLGAQVTWEPEPQKISIRFSEVTIETIIGLSKARVNGKVIYMDPELKEKVSIKNNNGITFIPLRFFSENIGCLVTWEAKKNQISIVYPNQNFKTPEIVDPPEDFDDKEWSRQYGISRADYVVNSSYLKGNLSLINNTDRSDGDFWFLSLDSSGKPNRSLLYSFPHYFYDSLNFTSQDNMFSAFVQLNKNYIRIIDLTKTPLLMNYCSINSQGIEEEEKMFSLTSPKKMVAEFRQAFPLQKKRHLLVFSLYQDSWEKTNQKGFVIIDSQGKMLDSFLIKTTRENNENREEVIPCGNDSFVYVIHHVEQNELKSMEVILFRENGEIVYQTQFNPNVTAYSYPEIIPCKNGFLLKMIHNIKSINYYARFSEDGKILWQREITLSRDRNEYIYNLQERPEGGFIYVFGSSLTENSPHEQQIIFLDKNGEFEKSFQLGSSSFAFITQFQFSQEGMLYLLGIKQLRNFAESNIWVSQFNPENPLYRYYTKGSKILLKLSDPLPSSSGITVVKKEKFPVNLEVKDLTLSIHEIPVDSQ
jgi:sugar lactone lactonase YvrE